VLLLKSTPEIENGNLENENQQTKIIKTTIVINRKTIFLAARYHRCLVNSVELLL
jgi:hypothetical protein